MNIFISWSGERSHKLATALRKWLPKVLPQLKNKENELVLSDSVEKGIQWFSTITAKLQSSDAGIICLTSEALSSSWLHFEAGALATRIEFPTKRNEAGGREVPSRLFTYLHGVTPSQLTGPLAMYQATLTTKEDTAQLVGDIARLLDLNEEQKKAWKNAFERRWKKFGDELNQIRVFVPELIPGFRDLFQRKTFQEPVQQCTAQSWLDRYNGAQATRAELLSHRAAVREACWPDQRELYENLLMQLDVYAMDIAALLLPRREPYNLNDRGELEIDTPGVQRACERRRLRVKEYVAALSDRHARPKTEDAVRFFTSESAEERQMLCRRLEFEVRRERPGEGAVGNARLEPARDLEVEECLASSWDFDRIAGYLRQEKREPPSASHLEKYLRSVTREMDLFRSRADAATALPVYYALRVLCAALPTETMDDMLKLRLKLTLQDIRKINGGADAPGHLPLENGGSGTDSPSALDAGEQITRILREVQQRMKYGARLGGER